jgi:S-adenosyl-L-methionine hydrolase (adenosine-forming)
MPEREAFSPSVKQQRRAASTDHQAAAGPMHGIVRESATEMPIVTLTTDFGRRDHYVAAMKGVILQIAPKTTVVDVTHHIKPQDVMHAAFVVRQIWQSFPRDTIHIVVVDPGVGSERRIIAAQFTRQLLISPDNGIVSFLHRDLQLEALRVVSNNRMFASTETANTFHGRDIMAPVAAHLCSGHKLAEVGPTADQLEILDLPKPEQSADRSIKGEVIYLDGFGNLVTNLTREDLAKTFAARPGAHVWLDDHDVGPLVQTYAQVEEGKALALIGSADMLEIAVNCGNAAKRFNADVGATVVVK